jgi:hypothetical protein
MGPYEWLSFLSFERYLSKYKKYMKLNISDFFPPYLVERHICSDDKII